MEIETVQQKSEILLFLAQTNHKIQTSSFFSDEFKQDFFRVMSNGIEDIILVESDESDLKKKEAKTT